MSTTVLFGFIYFRTDKSSEAESTTIIRAQNDTARAVRTADSCNGTEPIQIAKASVLQAHCTNLCPQGVGRHVTPVSDALDLAMEVGQLIQFSPKRSSLFQSMQFQLLCDIPSLKPLCPT